MKILHTSDWHLGKRLEQFSRFEEQQAVLAEIIQIAHNEQVDAVVIAGDLFDVFNPSVEAVELLYVTLKKLSNNGTRPVIAIAGNHDSPDRVEAPDPLAKINGILFSGYPNTRISELKIDGGFAISQTDNGFVEIVLPSGELLRILHTPFASEQRLKRYFDKTGSETISDYLKLHWETLANKYCDNAGCNILVSHLLMATHSDDEIVEPDDEKPIEHISEKMGSSIIPDKIDYVALGHLHRYQYVSGATCPVVYSGSPVAYSFSEANQTKKVVIAEKHGQQNLTYKTIDLQAGKKLLKKKFQSLDETKLWLQEHQDCLVECTIYNDEFFKPSELKQLHEIHKGIITIIPDVHIGEKEHENESMVDLSKSREELFVEYFVKKHQQNPNEEIVALFKEVLAVE